MTSYGFGVPAEGLVVSFGLLLSEAAGAGAFSLAESLAESALADLLSLLWVLALPFP